MQHSRALEEAKNVEVNVFDGPCPAGNVGVQVNHIDPVNKGEVVMDSRPIGYHLSVVFSLLAR